MVDLLPDAEQQQIIDAVADFLTRELPFERVRHAGPSVEVGRWSEFGRLGYFGITLPEEAGGIGLGMAEEMLVFREFGRHLVDIGVLATALGAWVAHEAGDCNLARRLSSGEMRVAIAHAGACGALAQASSLTVYGRSDAEYVLAWNAGGAALWSSDRLGAVVPLNSIDGLTPIERTEILPGGAAIELESPIVQRRGDILAAAMLVGVAEAACAMAVEYAKAREQFGRPIGAFQAVQHQCADMALRSEAARWQVVFAALSAAGGNPDSDFQAMSAKLLATDAALKNAAANIQIHGGIGYTYEYGAHHLLRRARILDGIGGDMRQQQARILQSAGPA